MDPAEVRRRNLVPPDAFPYTTPSGATYDTGEYAAALDKVLAAAGYPELRAEQARRRERGDAVQLGIGVSCYVEITAGDYSGGETSRLVVDGTGAATVYTGSSRARPGAPHRVRHAGDQRAGHPDGPDHRDPRRHRRGATGRSGPTGPGRCSSAAVPCTRPRSRSRSRRAAWPPA